MSEFESALSRLHAEIRGEVLADRVSLGLYATDASMYQIQPLAVVLPLDREDALRAVRICGEHRVPILPRGGGTSLTGQTVNAAVVIDASKHMNRVLEVNVADRWVRVEPGLVGDELNAALKPHVLMFAPDPATGNRANIGGMLANNAAGMRSIKHGMSIDHVLSLDLALATGEVLNLGPADAAAIARKCALRDREGDIYRGFRDLIDTHRNEIRQRYPKVIRRSGGYALDAFAHGPPWNMARIIVSSEGTLGMILEATLRLVPVPLHSGLCLAHFGAIGECLRAIAPIVSHGPSAVELLDGLIVRQAREHALTRETCGVIEGDPEALLVIEAQGDSPEEVKACLDAVVDDLRARGMGYALPVMTDRQAIRDVWLMRTSALGLITTVKGNRKPVPYVEDAAIPPEELPEYIEAVLGVCKRYGQPVSLFAHASVGVLHIRPMHDLHAAADIAMMKKIQDEVFELVVKHHGSWSGEHGDGIVRGGYNRRFFGDRLYEAFRELKHLFDPLGLMNPGRIVDTPAVDSNLRFGAAYRALPIPTRFHYRNDEGFLKAVEQCTGVGACRKTLDGVMCPSYIATRDEAHSTRGRANALRLAITGQLGADAMSSRELYDVFALCLACKGCKAECPSAVDVAKLKGEVLQQYHVRHGFALRDYLFAHSPALAALAVGPQATLINAVMRSAASRWLLDRAAGIDARRPMPPYARRRLSTSCRPRPVLNRPGVVLFSDTYMEYHLPEVGQAAVAILEAAGYGVHLVRVGDSQRPALSRGMLDVARRRGGRVLEKLAPYARQGLPILVCEPSCATALADDVPDLLDDEELGSCVAARVSMVDTFLERELAAGRCRLDWLRVEPAPHILVHGHCHQKAMDGGWHTLALLRRIPGAYVANSQAGCCGMAGAFGYEKAHYDLSVKVASDRLLPALEALPVNAVIVTNGFSCRHQVSDLTGRRARHVMEVLFDYLDFEMKGDADA